MTKVANGKTVTDSETIIKPHGLHFGIRHLQCILLFFASLIAYWVRFNVSVAIVAMTNPEKSNPNFAGFDWNEKEKSYILSSFFWGYMITQLPGGILSKKYGSKILILNAILIPSVLTIITPMCAQYGGWKLFCAVRVVQGFVTGVIFPAMHTHLSKWIPIEERNRLGAFTYSGVELGTLTAFLTSGFIAASDLGWPGIFYISGSVGIIWSIIWFFVSANTVDEVNFMDPIEKKYIQLSIRHSESDTNFQNEDTTTSTRRKSVPIPWKAIFTSIPVISLTIVRMSQAWGSQTIVTEMPTYMNSILKMDIESNAIFSALPYFVMWILSLVFIVVAEIISRGTSFTLEVIRKLFSSIGQWIPALALTGLAFTQEDQKIVAVCLLVVAVGANSASTLGSTLNHIDLSPNYAGLLMGLANTMANVINLIVPLIIGAILTDEEDQSRWQIVFLIAAGVFLVGNLIYVIFGRASAQSWDDLTEEEKVARTSRRESIFMEHAPHVIQHV